MKYELQYYAVKSFNLKSILCMPAMCQIKFEVLPWKLST